MKKKTYSLSPDVSLFLNRRSFAIILVFITLNQNKFKDYLTTTKIFFRNGRLIHFMYGFFFIKNGCLGFELDMEYRFIKGCKISFIRYR